MIMMIMITMVVVLDMVVSNKLCCQGSDIITSARSTPPVWHKLLILTLDYSVIESNWIEFCLLKKKKKMMMMVEFAHFYNSNVISTSEMRKECEFNWNSRAQRLRTFLPSLGSRALARIEQYFVFVSSKKNYFKKCATLCGSGRKWKSVINMERVCWRC